MRFVYQKKSQNLRKCIKRLLTYCSLFTSAVWIVSAKIMQINVIYFFINIYICRYLYVFNIIKYFCYNQDCKLLVKSFITGRKEVHPIIGFGLQVNQIWWYGDQRVKYVFVAVFVNSDLFILYVTKNYCKRYWAKHTEIFITNFISFLNNLYLYILHIQLKH